MRSGWSLERKMNSNALPKFKRCMEWYAADPAFRALMERAPQEAIRQLGFEEALEGAQVLEAIQWLQFHKTPGDPGNPWIVGMNAHHKAIFDHIEASHGMDCFASETLWQYEENTRNRCRMEFHALRENAGIYYYPFAFELSKGCSVQCPFCGLAAEQHQGDFAFTPENEALFQGVVTAAKEFAGSILSSCPLYFATEPFDNPDYEKFMTVYREITGGVPQTTTAIANRFPDRIRSWMHAVGPQAMHERAALRISIRSLAQFRKITAAYTPEELMDVELLANNPESIHRCSDSGRASRGSVRTAESSMAHYSICCVSGFRVNLVERTAAFLEPEIPDEEFPLGYRIREIQHFETPEDFRKILAQFGERYVHDRLPRVLPLFFNKNIRIQEERDRFVFLGDRTGYQIGRNLFTEAVITGIRSHRCFEDILQPLSLNAEGQERLYEAFNALFVRGYLRA